MTVSVPGREAAAGLLLVGLGTPSELTTLAVAAARLAAAADLTLRCLDRWEDPDAALGALAAGGSAGGPARTGRWLGALPLDPGLPLAAGGSWAEALGAWRQPALLVVRGEQIATGLPAAGTALLQRWQVPLVGLVQAGGDWSPGQRRRDGLPWLGWLPAEGDADPEALQELLAVLQRRWRWIAAD